MMSLLSSPPISLATPKVAIFYTLIWLMSLLYVFVEVTLLLFGMVNYLFLLICKCRKNIYIISQIRFIIIKNVISEEFVS